MKFGPLPVSAAEGAILAHSVTVDDGRLRKGVTLTVGHLERLSTAGVTEVVVAQLEPGDLHEDEAARRLAAALVADPEMAHLKVTDPFTGRVNLLAAGPGVVELDVAAIERFNLVHPMITVATVPPFQQMAAGGMVATIKVISYAVSERDVAAACAEALDTIRLRRPIYKTAGLVISDIPGGPSNDKGIRSISARVEGLGMSMADIQITDHDPDALADAVQRISGDFVMILTGSATSDPEDVAPSAVRLAGGQVERFGMPVDPGNLLFLGKLGTRPIIGLPGCARAPALNGADWVLSRVACGLTVRDRDIAAMGVGGLLKEIPTRPQPRAGKRHQ
ncbi:molybdopterin-binding protein [Phaeobacter sp. NW0010-22]|uniref:molybdopterin-binding protein n=1 Tax=Phaeobacter sp. NW0010-22 TaxID=3135907 RepID=UPI0031057E94